MANQFSSDGGVSLVLLDLFRLLYILPSLPLQLDDLRFPLINIQGSASRSPIRANGQIYTDEQCTDHPGGQYSAAGAVLCLTRPKICFLTLEQAHARRRTPLLMGVNV